MKGIIIFSLLAFGSVAIAIHYNRIVDYDRLYQDKIAPVLLKAKIIEKSPRHIVIGLDITAGREGELAKDREAIGKIIREARLGDRIEVFLIHSRSESDQEALISLQMPDSPGPAGLGLARAKGKAEAEWHQSWSGVDALAQDGERKGQTDLVGFLRFCMYQKPEFQASAHPLLVLFSDGQQIGDGYNFEKNAPGNADLKSMANQGFMPDLSGVSLWIAGVTPTHGISNSHWRKIQAYWISFAKTAGARSVAVSSNRVLRLEDAEGATAARALPTGSYHRTLANLP